MKRYVHRQVVCVHRQDVCERENKDTPQKIHECSKHGQNEEHSLEQKAPEEGICGYSNQTNQ